MLQKVKRHPEIFLGVVLSISIFSMAAYTVLASVNISYSEEPTLEVVEGFDKYELISQPKANIELATNDIDELAEINALVEEYNNSIPDLTEEDLEKYTVKVSALPSTSVETYLNQGNKGSFFQTSSQYSYIANTDTTNLLGQLQAWGISYGSASNETANMTQYDEMIQYAIAKHQNEYPIPVNLIKAMILQESSGNPNAKGSASGLMQIEYVNNQNFINYGRNAYGETWTEEDLLDPMKNIDYGVYVFAGNLSHYNGDYLKAVQSYNYSYYSLDRLINAYGSNWINARIHMAELNGRSSYGDPLYLEHVFQYYY